MYTEKKRKCTPRTTGVPPWPLLLPEYRNIQSPDRAEGTEWCQKTRVWILTFRMLLINKLSGGPGWLSWLRIWLLILAQVLISQSWNWALDQALCPAGSLLESLFLPLPLPTLPLGGGGEFYLHTSFLNMKKLEITLEWSEFCLFWIFPGSASTPTMNPFYSAYFGAPNGVIQV